MNRNLKILPYRNGSVSAQALAEALECKQIRLRSSTIHSMRPKTVINWGNSGRNLPPQGLGSQHTILNPMDKVSVAGNKLKTLQALSEASVSIPEFTTDIETATEWRNAGHIVVERHTLTGNSGDGIRIVDGSQGVEEAPLYTKYVKKQAEYRIHIMKGQVIDVQRKARSRDVADEDVNWQVRNRDGGFIFARGDANPPQAAIDEALAAVETLGLDFGAVDIIHNVRQDKVYVLEVNTACGLEGTTLERYTAAFHAVLDGSLPESVWDDTMTEDELAEAGRESVEDAFAEMPDALQPETLEEVIEQSSPAPAPLQAGDRVRLLRRGYLSILQEVGTIFTVEVVDEDSFFTEDGYILHLNGEGDGWERVTEENNSEPTPTPVVQSTTGSKFLIAVDGMCFIEKGVFNSRQEAQADIDSGFHYNLKQMNPDKVFEIKEI